MRVVVLSICVICCLSGATRSQPGAEAPRPTRELEALARQLPECKEFRNACQVCKRLSDGKLGCSNIGVACNPSGEWRCSGEAKETTK